MYIYLKQRYLPSHLGNFVLPRARVHGSRSKQFRDRVAGVASSNSPILRSPVKLSSQEFVKG